MTNQPAEAVSPLRISDATDSKAGQSLLDILDSRPLDRHYWRCAGLLTTVLIFDIFDFFLVSFLISVVGPAWMLTYAETAIVLLAAGVGSIIGGVVCGHLSDRFGRKPLIIAAIFLCGFSSGAVAFIPDGGWMLFAVLRFFVGFAVTGVATASGALIVEYTPTRVRTGLTSALAIPAGVGVLVASVLAAVLLPVIGWRGLAALGFIPVVFGLIGLVALPESPRWLISQGRGEEVRRRLARQMGVAVETLPPSPDMAVRGKSGPARTRELWADPQRFWLVVLMWAGISSAVYGVLLWGPTVLSMLLSISPAEAAEQFILISIAGIVGRVFFAIAPQYFGRRRCGQVAGFGGALCLCGAAFFHDSFLGAMPAFVAFLIAGALFYEGGTVNLGPWPAEIFPVRLAARGMGLSQAANGIGKIAGPLCLALLAGSDNLVTPKATEEAVLPAFLFLAFCCGLVGLVCTLIPIETHKRVLALDDAQR